MNDRDLASLFVTLAGYWPTTAPTIDDPIAVAAHRDLLADLNADRVLDAVRKIATDGREFCPPPGVIAATVGTVVPPYFRDYVPELPEAPPAAPDAVKRHIAEARAALRGAGSIPTSGGAQ